jgi:enamine deaminase RidA (YjgF/YER057c/UK114 family)
MKKMNPETLTSTFNTFLSQVVVVSPSKLAFISGQVAVNEQGEFVGGDDYGLQAFQVFKNIKLAIEAAGAGPEHIVQMKIHVVGHRPELVEVIFKSGFDVFGSEWPLTASTYLGVQSLGLPEWLIEVDVIVALL